MCPVTNQVKVHATVLNCFDSFGDNLHFFQRGAYSRLTISYQCFQNIGKGTQMFLSEDSSFLTLEFSIVTDFSSFDVFRDFSYK